MQLDQPVGAFLDTVNVIYPSDLRNGSVFWTKFTFITSSVGIALSVAALVLLLLTALIFAEWRQNYKNQMLLQFMIVRFLYTFVRYTYDVRSLYGIRNYENTTTIATFVVVVYTEYALVIWMFLFSKQMYNSFVTVFHDDKTQIWKISLVAWLVPLVVSLSGLFICLDDGISLKVIITYYALLKWPILFANAIMLIVVLVKILSNNISRCENNVRITFVMIILVFSFCFQQILVDIYKVVSMIYMNKSLKISHSVHIMFAISNGGLLYHCALSISFWVFGNAKTRQMWKTKLTSWLCRHKHNRKILRTVSTISK